MRTWLTANLQTLPKVSFCDFIKLVKMKKNCLLMAISLIALQPAMLHAQENIEPTGQTADDQLFDVPLEDLLTLESTSVAKKRQKVSESAAAVYVINQNDIRRSSATSIPDLLRSVPGLEVGDQQNGRTVVAVRGFKSIFTNSLLVMVDGRSIYVSTISGVFWDQLMIPLTDIERIEVVRGPGATLWGANAVNGVINIITKHSGDAIGAKADVRVSTKEQEASITFGDRINDALSFRLSANVRHDNGPTDLVGKDLSRRHFGKGFSGRIDWEPTERDAYTLQAEYSDGKFDFPFGYVGQNLLTPGYEVQQTENSFEAVNVLGRWTHRSSENLDWSVQAYFDRIGRTEIGTARLTREQSDLDVGVRWKANETHEINAGIGGRIITDSGLGTRGIVLSPSRNTDRWLSGYIQDDISLVADKLRLTVGTKLEKNNFTGFEAQPSAKLFIRPSKHFALWGGVSRAVRTPSRFERNAIIDLLVDLPNTPLNPAPLPLYTRIVGDTHIKAERLTAYEAGFRAQLGQDWSVDVAAYYNHYDQLSSFELLGVTPIVQPPIPFPLGLQAVTQFGNAGNAKTWGLEAVVKGNVTPWWKTEISYAHFDFKQPNDPLTGQPTRLLFPLQGSPSHTAALTNDVDFGDSVSVRSQLRYVGELFGGLVPDYFSLDGRLTYRIGISAELSLIGENLLSKRRLEFIQPNYQTPPAYVPRSVAVQGRIRF